MLTCVVHRGDDGLRTNPNGEVHAVIIPVPVSLMEKTGHTNVPYWLKPKWHGWFLNAITRNPQRFQSRFAAMAACPKHIPPSFGGSLVGTKTEKPTRSSEGTSQLSSKTFCITPPLKTTSLIPVRSRIFKQALKVTSATTAWNWAAIFPTGSPRFNASTMPSMTVPAFMIIG